MKNILFVAVLVLILRTGLPDGNLVRSEDIGWTDGASRGQRALFMTGLRLSPPDVQDWVVFKTARIGSNSRLIALPFRGWRVL